MPSLIKLNTEYALSSLQDEISDIHSRVFPSLVFTDPYTTLSLLEQEIYSTRCLCANLLTKDCAHDENY